MTLDEKIAAIEAGLKGVTIGPWMAFGEIVYFAERLGGFSLRDCPSPVENAAHIARLDPKTVGEIITERKADKARIVELEAVLHKIAWSGSLTQCVALARKALVGKE